MNLWKLRDAMKAINPEVTVSQTHQGCWSIRTSNNLDKVRAALRDLGLDEVDSDVEGSQWDWRHCLIVRSPEGQKGGAK